MIKENEEATGSRYLHGKGKLDKILKDIKDEINFSVNKNHTEKLKAEHLKGLEKKALKEAIVSDSGHFFREDIVALTDFIKSSFSSWEHEKHRTFHRHPEAYNPKEEIRIAKQLRILLLNSHDLSDKKLEILKSRIEAEIKGCGRYGSGIKLAQILGTLKTKIDNPKKLKP